MGIKNILLGKRLDIFSHCSQVAGGKFGEGRDDGSLDLDPEFGSSLFADLANGVVK